MRIAMFLLFILLFSSSGSALPNCIYNYTGPPDLFEVRFLNACDYWQAPHLVNPMLIMIMGHSPKWAILISLLFEGLEVIMVLILKSYVVFIGVTAVGFESLPDSILSDGIIQPLMGIVLGQAFIWFFRSPALWRGWRTDRGRFMWWLLWYLLMIVTQITLSYRLGALETGYPIGALITISLEGLLILLMHQNEPGREESWAGRPDGDRHMFWAAFLAVYLSFMLIVQADFLAGSFYQTVLLFVVWLVVFFVCALVQGRLLDMLRWLDWGGQYLRDRARILAERRVLKEAKLREV